MQSTMPSDHLLIALPVSLQGLTNKLATCVHFHKYASTCVDARPHGLAKELVATPASLVEHCVDSGLSQNIVQDHSFLATRFHFNLQVVSETDISLGTSRCLAFVKLEPRRLGAL